MNLKCTDPSWNIQLIPYMHVHLMAVHGSSVSIPLNLYSHELDLTKTDPSWSFHISSRASHHAFCTHITRYPLQWLHDCPGHSRGKNSTCKSDAGIPDSWSQSLPRSRRQEDMAKIPRSRAKIADMLHTTHAAKELALLLLAESLMVPMNTFKQHETKCGKEQITSKSV